MAGGKNAADMPCMICEAKATRTYEGEEEDVYLCENDHDFTVDWSRGGEPGQPLWPPGANVAPEPVKKKKKKKKK